MTARLVTSPAAWCAAIQAGSGLILLADGQPLLLPVAMWTGAAWAAMTAWLEAECDRLEQLLDDAGLLDEVAP